MAEYWQDVLERVQATDAVWQAHFPTLSLGATGFSDFNTLMLALPGTVQARDNAVQALDGARQQRDFTAERLRWLSLRVPKVIEGMVDPESGLLDDLDKVYAFTPETFAKIMRRSQALVPVWAEANGWLGDQNPTLAPIVVGTVTQAAFETMVNGFVPTETEVAKKDEAFSIARGKVSRDSRALETLCIRFLKAATGLAEPGTAAEDSLATIPTTSSSNLPDALGIRTFSQGGQNGLQLLVAYSPYALAPDETAVLQYKRLDVDADWQETPYDASGNAIGPFEVGQTVEVRTKVTNTSGSREGGKRQLTLIAPPQVV